MTDRFEVVESLADLISLKESFQEAIRYSKETLKKGYYLGNVKEQRRRIKDMEVKLRIIKQQIKKQKENSK